MLEAILQLNVLDTYNGYLKSYQIFKRHFSFNHNLRKLIFGRAFFVSR